MDRWIAGLLRGEERDLEVEEESAGCLNSRKYMSRMEVNVLEIDNDKHRETNSKEYWQMKNQKDRINFVFS